MIDYAFGAFIGVVIIVFTLIIVKACEDDMIEEATLLSEGAIPDGHAAPTEIKGVLIPIPREAVSVCICKIPGGGGGR